MDKWDACAFPLNEEELIRRTCYGGLDLSSTSDITAFVLVIHYGFIEKFIEELGTKYHIKEIAFDRWGATQMVHDLEGMGFTVVPFGQGYKDIWHLTVQSVIREVYMMAGEFLFFKK